MLIRVEIGIDAPGIDALLRRTFGRDAEAQLVHDLREDGLITLGVVATDDEGQVIVLPLPSARCSEELQWVGWPLAVDERYRGQGIGRQLVYEGLDSLNEFGYAAVVTLGDPDLYRRFGFEPAARFDLRCRWPDSAEAFQVTVWRMTRSKASTAWSNTATTLILLIFSRVSKASSPATRRSFSRFVSCLMRYSSRNARVFTNFVAKGQLQVAFAAQRLRVSRLMLAKAARHIGGDAGIKAIIRGSNDKETSTR
jgi:putative acetyltransferase